LILGCGVITKLRRNYNSELLSVVIIVCKNNG